MIKIPSFIYQGDAEEDMIAAPAIHELEPQLIIPACEAMVATTAHLQSCAECRQRVRRALAASPCSSLGLPPHIGVSFRGEKRAAYGGGFNFNQVGVA